jgi:NAD(P)-dependent dehydrogenase (short-subunit alcohol dehydrogenase family)
MKKLEGKVIVITGACGLLGKAFVASCLNENAFVVLADLDNKINRQLISSLPAEKILFVACDITKTESVLNLIDTTVNKFSRIDAVVNNAYPRNKYYGNKLEEVSSESFNENITLHLGAYYSSLKEFSSYFLKQGFGQVVSMGSIYGVVAPRFEIYDNTPMTMPVEYAAIKSAIIHLTKYFAAYYKEKNIQYNCISPGGIFNNQPEEFVKKYEAYAPMLSPSDIAEKLIELISTPEKFKNGQNILLDNGWSNGL